MEVGLVQKIDIDQEMQQAYLDYAMSIIVARALPDARDGLKPVHRRILYAMYDMGLRPSTPFKKSARIVGEVLGKYHPHGDMAVYDAMARMAQDFSMRCLLVEGQGNFGSVDGDPPAAMRYTEARLAAPAMDILADIQKNTVDFESNFDGSLEEPTVLPAAIPNLLVNGAIGIAVGMSTSIPPHNLGEVVDALVHMLENWQRIDDISIEDLMRFIQGPDFPTGGIIIQEQDGSEESLSSAYGSGRGRVVVQARAHLEEMERGRSRIIVTELPYMTNKSNLIERIAELVREERITGISDLRDESDRQGMRIVIEVSKTGDAEAVLADLYKHTPMQSTFSIIMLALVEGEPRMLALKQALRVYLDHRLEIIKRRSEYDLEKARQRAHILEGLRVALKNLDEVIALIRQAPDVDTARARLMKRFKLSDIQAQAILDMQLRRLAALERKKIEEEYKEVTALIKQLEALLRSPARMRQVAAEELLKVKEAYGERRRTQIVQLKEGQSRKALLTARDLVAEQAVWVCATADGLLSRTSDDKPPRQSGSDAPRLMIRSNTVDTLYLAAENGEAAALAVHALPEAEKPGDGTPFYKLSALSQNDRLACLLSLPGRGERMQDWFVLSATRQGMVKKSSITELPGPSAGTFTLARVNEGDRLGWLRLTDGKSQVLMLTAQGMAIRFSEEEVRPMGLVAAGVMGLKLQNGDEVVGVETLPQPGEVFMAASDGSAKRLAESQFPLQGRYGQGVSAWKLPAKVTVVGMMVGKGTERVTLHLDKLAPKMTRLDAAPLQARAARGKSVVELKPGDQVLSLTIAWEPPRPENGSVDKPKRSRSTSKPAASESRGKEKAAPASGKTATAAKRKPAAKAASSTKVVASDNAPTRSRKAAATSTTTASAAAKTAPAKKPAAAKPTAKGKAAGLTAKAPARKEAAASAPPASKAKKPAAETKPSSSTAGKPASKAAATSTGSAKTTSGAAKKPASKTTSGSASAGKKPAAKTGTGSPVKKPASKATTTGSSRVPKKTPAPKKPAAGK
jgi:DNA gyrase subunit A